ncbi:MAG: heparinase [Lachnospiraceae bacterium]|nr:heparinase [Lachnospiraceae bacterium]
MLKEIEEHAVITGLFDTYPAASDRKAWEGIPESYREQLVKEGEKWLGYQFLPIYATDFMEFSRTGNRSSYESKLFQRRTVLNALVLAECVQHQGRFLDEIINGIFVICEESAWQLPAHNTYVRDTPQHILPDVSRPVVDLFAAETGAVLAMAEYLLRDALGRVSPVISKMVDRNLWERVLKPYQREHFWWMGDGVSPMNNWTAWCTQNVLAAAFTRELPQTVQKEIIKKACKSLDYFLDEYGEDGCCDEGAQYYRHAGLTLFNAVEILNQISGNAFLGLYQEKKIQNIASYIRKVHVAGEYYVNFADCSPIAGRCRAREYLFGKRTGNQALMAFAARDYKDCEDWLDLEEHNLMYRVQAAFCHKEIMELAQEILQKEAKRQEAGEKGISEEDCYFPSAGLFVARDDRFCLAVKAGDNADSHNHNDVGSFTIYKDGQPMFIDVGVESYTKKTFSPERYTIWTMQSKYHNLPTFGQVMEKDGQNYKARDVKFSLGTDCSWISMDLSGAYPPCRIQSYVRKASLEKGGQIQITDVWEGDEDAKKVVLSLMTYEKPCILQDPGRPESKNHQEMDLGNQDGTVCIRIGSLGNCCIKGAAGIETEEIPITDPRLKLAWKHNVFRTLVSFKGNTLEIKIPRD